MLTGQRQPGRAAPGVPQARAHELSLRAEFVRQFRSPASPHQAQHLNPAPLAIPLPSGNRRSYDLGYIDQEETLQPLQNPFGPKV
jgi:hypothetical protein